MVNSTIASDQKLVSAPLQVALGVAANNGEIGTDDLQKVAEDMTKAAEAVLNPPDAASASNQNGASTTATTPTISAADKQEAETKKAAGMALTQLAAPSRNDTPQQRAALASINPTMSAATVSALTLQGVDANWSAIKANRKRLDTLEAESREGTAMAMALGGLNLPNDAKHSLGIRYGNFRGKGAVALGAAMKWNQSTKIDVGVAYGTDHKQSGYSAGVTFMW